MDSLLSTFEQIKIEGEAYINRVISERHQEGLKYGVQGGSYYKTAHAC